MSKILFSADWHIKLGQKNVPIEWQKNRFKMLYKMLNDLCHDSNIDYHIIGGDIFDSVPSLAELQLFTEFVVESYVPVYIFDGNHEATRKGRTFLEIIAPIFEQLNPDVRVLLGIQKLENMDIIPYTHLKTFNPKDFSNDILLTHVRGNIEPHVKAEIDLNKFNRWKTVLAGDLHSHTNSQANIIYPGSPMTVTFHRNATHTGVLIFDNNDIENINWKHLTLPQLIRKRVELEEEMIATNFDHTIYELTGNIEELSKARKSNPLLDKKIVKRKVDSQIDFSQTKNLVEELLLYLKMKGYVNTDNIIKAYNDYI